VACVNQQLSSDACVVREVDTAPAPALRAALSLVILARAIIQLTHVHLHIRGVAASVQPANVFTVAFCYA
jgi:hypothetical protein